MYSGEPSNIVVTTPEPFLRKITLNFVYLKGKAVVIPEGKWMDETGEKRLVLDRSGKVLRMVPLPVSEVSESFVVKYGADHFKKYFGAAETAYALEYSDESNDISGMVENYFDRVSASYQEDVLSDPVQAYMREITADALEAQSPDGSRVLDLGCGIMLESSPLWKRVKLEGADISGEMLKKASERFPSGSGVVLRKTDMMLNGEFGKYDIIFTSYGFLELVPAGIIRAFLKDHLERNGKFIGVFWNRLGIADLVLSALTGKFTYIRDKISGRIPPGGSRFPFCVEIRRIRDILPRDGFDIIARSGICFSMPPYNYTFWRKIRGYREAAHRVDAIFRNSSALSSFSDYTMVIACRK